MGSAWSDKNGNGLHDLGNPSLFQMPEMMVAGVTVQLLSNGNVVATTTTDSTGFYQFNVVAGSYSIRYVIPSQDTSASFTSERVGSDDTINSAANSSGYTSTFTLTAGQTWFAENVGIVGLPT